jgi:hypothetical protein
MEKIALFAFSAIIFCGLFNGTVKISDCMASNWKGFGRNRSWHNRSAIIAFAWRARREATKGPIIAGASDSN